MLWSLLKIVVFIAIVAALALGASYLMESEGGVQITVAGMEYTLGPLQSVLAATVLVVLLYVFFKLAGLVVAVLRWINGDDTAISRYFARNSERKGYQALSEGLMALASGEARLAMAKAQKADKYLHKPELTDLLTAQAAEMAGDSKKAEEVYKRLVQQPATRFVGVRGLMKQKLGAGDTDTAMKLAERAFAIKPQHEEVQDVLLRLQAEGSDYDGARKTLAAKLKHGQLPRDVFKRRDSVLALSQAAEIADEDASAKAADAAIAANKASPDLVPAAAMAAQAYIASGRKRNAVRVLKKAWQTQPHPDLAAAFAAIEPEETPAARIKRFGALMAVNNEHRETRLLKAELNLAAEDFPAARRAMGELADTDPDTRVMTIMAAIEKGEGAEDTVVRSWLARALTAPRGEQWVCDNCNTVHGGWAPLCSGCGAFDTLTWTRPPQSMALPSGAEMLPLIVGAIEDKTEAVVEPSVEDVELPAETPTEAAPVIEDAETVVEAQK